MCITWAVLFLFLLLFTTVEKSINLSMHKVTTHENIYLLKKYLY